MALSPATPDTLGILADRGIPLRAACRNCGHIHDWSSATLVKRHGRHRRWWDAKLLCPRCDSHGADLHVAPLIARLRVAA